MANITMQDQIRAANVGHLIRVRMRKSREGKTVLYLDYYSNGSRHVSYHGLELTLVDKVQDQEVFRYACALRDGKEADLMSGRSPGHGSPLPWFREYSLHVISEKNASMRRMYTSALNRFCQRYPKIQTSKISRDHAQRFYRGLTGLSSVTIDHYVTSLRYLCSRAIRDGYIKENPFADIHVKKTSIDRQFLTQDELRKLEALPPSEIRNAFLFSCYTGLRWGDVRALQMSNIREGYLYYRMKKTGAYERILLPSVVHGLLRYESGAAFLLPGHRRMMKHLKRLIDDAGIEKHITFHCARHTFATLCLTLGIDIYTVSKLLGHSDVRVTQVYAKLVDSKKDEAMMTLSRLGHSEPG